jgi:hypothetical protein
VLGDLAGRARAELLQCGEDLLLHGCAPLVYGMRGWSPQFWTSACSSIPRRLAVRTTFERASRRFCSQALARSWHQMLEVMPVTPPTR